ncbi:MAG TPA: hypothetical protein VLT83_17165 [Opitutaceae bacterium]|nr:hypothetical protein [Opitutaceae bacterium]
MGTAEVFSGREQGFAVVGLRTAAAELAMVPELGGRVISVRSRRTGREWCWHRPRPDWLWANQPNDDFGASPQAGVDECIPSVARCAWRGRAIPDHGEVWFQDWRLDPAALAAGKLRAEVRLTVSPLVFTRTIRAEAGGEFLFDYTLTNTGSASEAFVWSLHPLLTICPGDRLEMPAEVRSLRLNGGLGVPIAFGDTWTYPEPFPGVRLDRLELPGAPPGCMKGFAGPLREGWAALVSDGSGDRLELRWDARVIPFLGLWLNRGHGGFHHVALEPTNGAPDSLADAVERWQQFGVVDAGATVRWSVSWHLT